MCVKEKIRGRGEKLLTDISSSRCLCVAIDLIVGIAANFSFNFVS